MKPKPKLDKYLRHQAGVSGESKLLAVAWPRFEFVSSKGFLAS